MKPNLGRISENIQAVANELSIILADEYVLYTKTRNAHWDVVGADFYDKHKFFEIQNEQLDDFIDRVNERIRSIGHSAPSRIKSFLELTQLPEMRQEKTISMDL